MLAAPVKIVSLSIFPNKYAKSWMQVPSPAGKVGAASLHQKRRRCYSSFQQFLGRESQKNLGGGLSRRGQRFVRSRAAAGLLLLVVTAHAFVASATHFHSRSVAAPQSAQAAFHGDEGGGGSLPQAGDEAQCLLCRLQRSFVSDLQCAALAFAPPLADAPGYIAPRNTSARASRALLPSGRAPPSA